MIKEYGAVVVTKEGIQIVGFHFDGSDGSDGAQAWLDGLLWAKERITQEIKAREPRTLQE